MSSSDWIDDVICPERAAVNKMFSDMKTKTVEMIHGCKDAGATIEEAWFFISGMLYKTVPDMMGLINVWVREVYSG